ncbi:MAG: hypothetical protein Q3977_05220, partial [Oscillospiraceae bacterium]|nr:hypothetical protein [Oscillospiraceae bacterium]
TFLYIGEGASLTVNDSSQAKNGRIFAYGKMKTVGLNEWYNSYMTRDCIRVDGGELIVNAGTLESGRTKEYWAYDACNVGNWGYETWAEYEMFSNIVNHCHYRIDGYYYQIIGGDCIHLDGGTVTINGGKVLGRGYRTLDTKPNASTMEKIDLTAVRAAGIYAKSGKVTINGGQISGMANADALSIQSGVDVSIAAGVFYTQLISKFFVPCVDSKASWTHQLDVTYNDTFRLNRPDPGSGAGSLGFPSELLDVSKHDVTLDGKTLYPDYWKPKYITNTAGDGGHTLVVNSKAAQAVYTYNPADLAPKDIASAELSGTVAYDGFISPNSVTCNSTGVKSVKSQWYCGNEALSGTQKVGFGVYYANVTLTAAETYRFTAATKFTVNGQAAIGSSISGNGRYAHVWTSPAIFECDHRMNADSSVHYDADRHYQQCTVCGKIYMTEPHIMNSGTQNGNLTEYACLGCGFTRTTENGREGTYGVVVHIPVAMIGEKIPVPTMADGYNAYGKIMSYEWKKGNNLESAVNVNVGDAYESGSVYYMIVRVKANDSYYFKQNSVLGCNTGVKQGVDGDSEVLIGTYRIVPTSSALVRLSLPALRPGETMETFCKGIAATVGSENTSNFEIAIYRNGSDKYSFIKWSFAKGWSFYSGEGGDLATVFTEKILPDTPYRFVISVSTNGKYVPDDGISYSTGSKCEGAILTGGETWAEADLQLLSNSSRVYDIPIVNVDAPVTGGKPDVTFDIGADADGLTADIASWNTTEAFEGGKTYTFTAKVKLKDGYFFNGVPAATVNCDEKTDCDGVSRRRAACG